MPRRRVGVVVVLDPPVGPWVDGLRRAVGDAAVERIAPHITLVPPLNLRPGDLDAALATLRSAAAALPGPLELTIGAPATFAPVNPVLYLGVGGDLAGLRRLRDASFTAPLTRPLTWGWVPHVTIGDDLPPARLAALLGGLDRFAAVATVERVTLLEERHGTDPDGTGGRRWEPLADAALGPVAVVGRGGLAVALHRGRTTDPVAAPLLGEAVPAGRGVDDTVVVTAVVDDDGARRGVGAAVTWRADDGVHVRVAVEAAWRGRGIGSHLLAAAESAARDEGWQARSAVAEGPAGFYRARSSWAMPPAP